MKLEFWHKDMIRFMTDASEYGDYYRCCRCSDR